MNFKKSSNYDLVYLKARSILDQLNYKKLAKQILGKKGTDLARVVKNSFYPKKLLIEKNGKHFTVDCSKLRSYRFWNEFQSGSWEPSTFKIFDHFCDKDHSYIDIGAYVGPTVLYGCQIARHCFALEPDPIAFQELKNNIELNEHLKSRITLSKYCISDSIGTAKLFISAENKEYSGGSSSTILDMGYKKFWEVQTTTLQQFIQDFHITDCNFIKIDIEGAEFDIVTNMLEYLKNQKPTLLIEIHPMFVKEPFKNWDKMCKTLSVYDHMYNADLKEIDGNYIHAVNLARQFHIVWTDL